LSRTADSCGGRGQASDVACLAGFAVQTLILLTVLVTGTSTLTWERSTGSGGLDVSVDEVLLIALVVVVVAVAVVAAVPRTRHWLSDRLREASGTLRVLGSPKKDGQLFGGSFAAQCLSAAVLGLSVSALGGDVAFVDLLVINTMVSLFAGVMPVPGGIGVTEAGFTVGLVAAGLPQEQAFAAAILTRILTFYLPPVWGFFSLRWLQHRDYL